MKAGRTLQQLAQEIQRQQAAKRDFIADTRTLTMTPDLELRMRTNGDEEQFGITDICHRQIAAKTGIPQKYYDRMRADSPDLLAHNVQHWFEAQPEARMVRTMDGHARALLSDRYRPLDNYDLATAVFPIIADHAMKVESCEITESRLYLQCVAYDVRADIVPDTTNHTINKTGDAVAAGLVIQNSEVGLGSLSVRPLVFRLVCKNGLIVPEYGMRQTHVGRSHGEDSRELFTQETLQADDKAFFLKVRDTVAGVLQRDVFEGIVAKLQAATEDRVEGDVPETIELVGAELDLMEAEKSSVLTHLIEGGDLSRWGLINAVTATANDVESYDRAVELESVAAKLVDIAPTTWERIAKAA